MSITGVEAILLINQDAPGLAEFHKQVLGLPLQDEEHEGVPLHYAGDLGNVRFNIHSAVGWLGTHTGDFQSPVIALRTSDARAIAASPTVAGVKVAGPSDHGFALVVSFRDPDGNALEILQPTAA